MLYSRDISIHITRHDYSRTRIPELGMPGMDPTINPHGSGRIQIRTFPL